MSNAVNEFGYNYNNLIQLSEVYLNQYFMGTRFNEQMWDFYRVAAALVNTPGFHLKQRDRLRLGGNIDIIDVGYSVERLIKVMHENNYIPRNMDLWIGPSMADDALKETGGTKTTDSPHPKAANIITWRVSQREHASIDKQPFKGRQPAKWRYRENFWIPESPLWKEILYDTDDIEMCDISTDGLIKGDSVEVSSWWWDNILQFDCFAKTSSEAEDLCIAFEKTLLRYLHIFAKLGCQKFLHWGRQYDIDNEKDQVAKTSELPFRRVLFYVRTEEFFVTCNKVIESIEALFFAN